MMRQRSYVPHSALSAQRPWAALIDDDNEAPMTSSTEPTPTFVPAEAVLSTGRFVVEPARTMQAAGYPWEHEIRVALPVSYADSDKTYPVLWLTDNVLETALSLLGPLELIIVSIGADRKAGGRGSPRRAYDFYPREDILPRDPYGDFLRRHTADHRTKHLGGGAARFLEFLVDEVRPALAADYRMEADDHALEGYSAGGWFVMYALFTRPGAFAKYIAGAPALYFSNDLIWEIEEQFAATHDDLPAQLFLGAGDGEMTADFWLGCLSSMARMVETLSLRRYPSLDMTAKIFPGESHMTGLPFVISNAVQSLWGGRILNPALALLPPEEPEAS
jgi:predicted alpha/beta superfamily hydrolase